MELLTRLAANGRSLVAVIHQPRSSVYDMVHNLLLLSEGQVSGWQVDAQGPKPYPSHSASQLAGGSPNNQDTQALRKCCPWPQPPAS